MNRRSLLTAGVAFIGWLSSLTKAKAAVDTSYLASVVAPLKPLAPGASPFPYFDITSLFQKVNIGPGQVPEFPLDLFAPGEENNETSYVLNRRGEPERYVEADYIMVQTYKMKDKEQDILNLLMAAGRADDQHFYSIEKSKIPIVFEKRRKTGITIFDERLNFGECRYNFYDKKDKINPKLIQWNPESQALIIMIRDKDALVNPIMHNEEEGLSVLTRDAVSVIKVDL